MKQILWLKKLRDKGMDLSSSKKNLNIFGSAVASTWLSEEIGNKFKFFVDEDDARIGKKHLGKKIISPEEMSEEDILYIGLIPIIAKKISQKFKRFKFKVELPPDTSN